MGPRHNLLACLLLVGLFGCPPTSAWGLNHTREHLLRRLLGPPEVSGACRCSSCADKYGHHVDIPMKESLSDEDRRLSCAALCASDPTCTGFEVWLAPRESNCEVHWTPIDWIDTSADNIECFPRRGYAPVDLVILLDRSLSVKSNGWSLETEFTRKLLDALPIAPGEINVAIIHFGADTYYAMPDEAMSSSGDFIQTKEEALTAIDNLAVLELEYGTDLIGALHAMITVLKTKSRKAKQQGELVSVVPWFAVIITDGENTHRCKEVSGETFCMPSGEFVKWKHHPNYRGKNPSWVEQKMDHVLAEVPEVRRFCIGVRLKTQRGRDDLWAMASILKEDHVFEILSFELLDYLIEQLLILIGSFEICGIEKEWTEWICNVECGQGRYVRTRIERVSLGRDCVGVGEGTWTRVVKEFDETGGICINPKMPVCPDGHDVICRILLLGLVTYPELVKFLIKHIEWFEDIITSCVHISTYCPMLNVTYINPPPSFLEHVYPASYFELISEELILPTVDHTVEFQDIHRALTHSAAIPNGVGDIHLKMAHMFTDAPLVQVFRVTTQRQFSPLLPKEVIDMLAHCEGVSECGNKAGIEGVLSSKLPSATFTLTDESSSDRFAAKLQCVTREDAEDNPYDNPLPPTPAPPQEKLRVCQDLSEWSDWECNAECGKASHVRTRRERVVFDTSCDDAEASPWDRRAKEFRVPSSPGDDGLCRSDLTRCAFGERTKCGGWYAAAPHRHFESFLSDLTGTSCTKISQYCHHMSVTFDPGHKGCNPWLDLLETFSPAPFLLTSEQLFLNETAHTLRYVMVETAQSSSQCLKDSIVLEMGNLYTYRPTIRVYQSLPGGGRLLIASCTGDTRTGANTNTGGSPIACDSVGTLEALVKDQRHQATLTLQDDASTTVEVQMQCMSDADPDTGQLPDDPMAVAENFSEWTEAICTAACGVGKLLKSRRQLVSRRGCFIRGLYRKLFRRWMRKAKEFDLPVTPEFCSPYTCPEVECSIPYPLFPITNRPEPNDKRNCLSEADFITGLIATYDIDYASGPLATLPALSPQEFGLHRIDNTDNGKCMLLSYRSGQGLAGSSGSNIELDFNEMDTDNPTRVQLYDRGEGNGTTTATMLGSCDGDSRLIAEGPSCTSFLGPGSLAIIFYRAYEPDTFSFVTFVSICQGTQVVFTNNGWKRDDGGFRESEDRFTWTAPTEVTPGEVITFMSLIAASYLRLGDNGDQIFAYQERSDGEIVFIYGVNNKGEKVWQDDATNDKTSSLPSILAKGPFHMPLKQNPCIRYLGPTEGSTAFLLSSIADHGHWGWTDNTDDTFIPACPFAITDAGQPESGFYSGSSACENMEQVTMVLMNEAPEASLTLFSEQGDQVRMVLTPAAPALEEPQPPDNTTEPGPKPTARPPPPPNGTTDAASYVFEGGEVLNCDGSGMELCIPLANEGQHINSWTWNNMDDTQTCRSTIRWRQPPGVEASSLYSCLWAPLAQNPCNGVQETTVWTSPDHPDVPYILIRNTAGIAKGEVIISPGDTSVRYTVECLYQGGYGTSVVVATDQRQAVVIHDLPLGAVASFTFDQGLARNLVSASRPPFALSATDMAYNGPTVIRDGLTILSECTTASFQLFTKADGTSSSDIEAFTVVMSVRVDTWPEGWDSAVPLLSVTRGEGGDSVALLDAIAANATTGDDPRCPNVGEVRASTVCAAGLDVTVLTPLTLIFTTTEGLRVYVGSSRVYSDPALRVAIDKTSTFTLGSPMGKVPDETGTLLQSCDVTVESLYRGPQLITPDGVFPAHGATDVPLDQRTLVAFLDRQFTVNRPLQVMVFTIPASTIDVPSPPPVFVARFTKRGEGKGDMKTMVSVRESVMTVRLPLHMVPSTRYQVVIPAGSVADTHGQLLKTRIEWRFTTTDGSLPDNSPPVRLSSSFPSNGVTDVDPRGPIVIPFDGPVTRGYGAITIRPTDHSNDTHQSSLRDLALTIAIEDKSLVHVQEDVMVVHLPSPLFPYTTYETLLPAYSLFDHAGNPLQPPGIYIRFSTWDNETLDETAAEAGGVLSPNEWDTQPPSLLHFTSVSPTVTDVYLEMVFDEDVRVVPGWVYIASVEGLEERPMPVWLSNDAVVGSHLVVRAAGVAAGLGYSVIVPRSRIRDHAGNFFAGLRYGDRTFTVPQTTTSPSPLRLVRDLSYPPPDSTRLPPTSPVILTFSHAVCRPSFPSYILVKPVQAPGRSAIASLVDTSDSEQVRIEGPSVFLSLRPWLTGGTIYEMVLLEGTLTDCRGGRSPPVGESVGGEAFSFSVGAPTDGTPPTLVQLSPVAGSADVETSLRSLVLAFDEPVVIAPRATQSIGISRGGQSDREIGREHVKAFGSVVVIELESALRPGGDYGVSIPVGLIMDYAGNVFSFYSKWEFSTSALPTASASPLALLSAFPQSLAVGEPLTLLFNETISIHVTGQAIEVRPTNDEHAPFHIRDDGYFYQGELGSAQWTEGKGSLIATDGGLAVLSFPYPLGPSLSYNVTLPAGLFTGLNGSLSSETTISIDLSAAADAADQEPPRALYFFPPPEGIPLVSSDIIVSFTEDIAPSLNVEEQQQVTLKPDGGAEEAVPFTIKGSVLIATPASVLQPSTAYTLTIPQTAITDLSRNPMTGDVVYAFTTGQPPSSGEEEDTRGPAVLPGGVLPPQDATDVPPSVSFVVVFDGPVIVVGGVLAFAAAERPGVDPIFVDLHDAERVWLGGSAGNHIMIVALERHLLPDTQYTVTGPLGLLEDASGNALTYDVSTQAGRFTTGAPSAVPPTTLTTPTAPLVLSHAAPIPPVQLDTPTGDIILSFPHPFTRGSGVIEVVPESIDGLWPPSLSFDAAKQTATDMDVTSEGHVGLLGGGRVVKVRLGSVGVRLTQGGEYRIRSSEGALLALQGRSSLSVDASISVADAPLTGDTDDEEAYATIQPQSVTPPRQSTSPSSTPASIVLHFPAPVIAAAAACRIFVWPHTQQVAPEGRAAVDSQAVIDLTDSAKGMVRGGVVAANVPFLRPSTTFRVQLHPPDRCLQDVVSHSFVEWSAQDDWTFTTGPAAAVQPPKLLKTFTVPAAVLSSNAVPAELSDASAPAHPAILVAVFDTPIRVAERAFGTIRLPDGSARAFHSPQCDSFCQVLTVLSPAVLSPIVTYLVTLEGRSLLTDDGRPVQQGYEWSVQGPETENGEGGGAATAEVFPVAGSSDVSLTPVLRAYMGTSTSWYLTSSPDVSVSVSSSSAAFAPYTIPLNSHHVGSVGPFLHVSLPSVLPPSQTIIVTLPAQAIRTIADGTPLLQSDIVWRFSTEAADGGGTAWDGVIDRVPLHRARDVATDTHMRLVFDRAVYLEVAHNSPHMLALTPIERDSLVPQKQRGSVDAAALPTIQIPLNDTQQVMISGSVLVVTPRLPLFHATTYSATISSTALLDSRGAAWEGIDGTARQWRFTTRNVIRRLSDVTPPTLRVTSIRPAPGSRHLPLSTSQFVMRFTEPVLPGSAAKSAAVSFRPADTSKDTIHVYTDDPMHVRIDGSSVQVLLPQRLEPSTVYTAYFSKTAFTDLAGNQAQYDSRCVVEVTDTDITAVALKTLPNSSPTHCRAQCYLTPACGGFILIQGDPLNKCSLKAGPVIDTHIKPGTATYYGGYMRQCWEVHGFPEPTTAAPGDEERRRLQAIDETVPHHGSFWRFETKPLADSPSTEPIGSRTGPFAASVTFGRFALYDRDFSAAELPPPASVASYRNGSFAVTLDLCIDETCGETQQLTQPFVYPTDSPEFYVKATTDVPGVYPVFRACYALPIPPSSPLEELLERRITLLQLACGIPADPQSSPFGFVQESFIGQAYASFFTIDISEVSPSSQQLLYLACDVDLCLDPRCLDDPVDTCPTGQRRLQASGGASASVLTSKGLQMGPILQQGQQARKVYPDGTIYDNINDQVIVKGSSWRDDTDETRANHLLLYVGVSLGAAAVLLLIASIVYFKRRRKRGAAPLFAASKDVSSRDGQFDIDIPSSATKPADLSPSRPAARIVGQSTRFSDHGLDNEAEDSSPASGSSHVPDDAPVEERRGSHLSALSHLRILVGASQRHMSLGDNRDDGDDDDESTPLGSSDGREALPAGLKRRSLSKHGDEESSPYASSEKEDVHVGEETRHQGVDQGFRSSIVSATGVPAVNLDDFS
ncbi:unnamed protein product [Vitrella brassicaformis CCMP3155]|uniref:VWFA domain-containing protein n=6 Tax=Vitrella brassicaformis TaxID=1169539 RepID=A0A0G4FZK6_VITBC|nr:unnamed protein product [Vitrella brassicaformis CCMP3155]|eukprot:CEM21066.1 unnamed protein product [Vitrella brassicaformis CCMP3155]